MKAVLSRCSGKSESGSRLLELGGAPVPAGVLLHPSIFTLHEVSMLFSEVSFHSDFAPKTGAIRLRRSSALVVGNIKMCALSVVAAPNAFCTKKSPKAPYARLLT